MGHWLELSIWYAHELWLRQTNKVQITTCQMAELLWRKRKHGASPEHVCTCVCICMWVCVSPQVQRRRPQTVWISHRPQGRVKQPPFSIVQRPWSGVWLLLLLCCHCHRHWGLHSPQLAGGFLAFSVAAFVLKGLTPWRGTSRQKLPPKLKWGAYAYFSLLAYASFSNHYNWTFKVFSPKGILGILALLPITASS